MLDAWINRSDCHGGYRQNGTPYTAKQPVTPGLVEKHVAGETTIGLHAVSLEQTCRWCCWDIDAHDGEDPDENLQRARLVAETLRGHGLEPWIEDSDGRGGFHVWVHFRNPIPAEDAYRLGQACSGPGIEAFPKQASVAAGKYGSWVRLPGKHHRRNHWSALVGREDGRLEWSEHVESYLEDPPLSEPPPTAALAAPAPRNGLAATPTGVEPLDVATGFVVPEKARAGQRNVTLARLAGAIRRPGLSAEAIAAALDEENRRLCDPPLPSDEVRKIAQSIAQYPPGADIATAPATVSAAAGARTIDALNDFISRYHTGDPAFLIDGVMRRGIPLGAWELHLRDGPVVELADVTDFRRCRREVASAAHIVLAGPLKDQWLEIAQWICEIAEIIPVDTEKDETTSWVRRVLASGRCVEVKTWEDLATVAAGRVPLFELKGSTYVVASELLQWLAKKGVKVKSQPDLTRRLTAVGCVQKRPTLRGADRSEFARVRAYELPRKLVVEDDGDEE